MPICLAQVSNFQNGSGDFSFFFLRISQNWMLVAHTRNPIYLGGRSGGSWVEANPGKKMKLLSQK
jgi:hypothetical protein